MRRGRTLRKTRLQSINPVEGERAVFTLAFADLAPCAPAPESFSPLRPCSQSSSCFPFFASLSARMAPQQPLTIVDPLAWERSTVTRLALNQLVTGGQLAANEDGRPAEWIVPSERERAPNLPSGYVVSFVRFHERGFMAPASRFMRALCHHYGVELHNFSLNAISQAATFVGVCEGFLGIPVNWDLWVTSSARSCSHCRRQRRGPAARCVPAACRSPCGASARTTTSPAR
jgi:hypothetical protein